MTDLFLCAKALIGLQLSRNCGALVPASHIEARWSGLSDAERDDWLHQAMRFDDLVHHLRKPPRAPRATPAPRKPNAESVADCARLVLEILTRAVVAGARCPSREEIDREVRHKLNASYSHEATVALAQDGLITAEVGALNWRVVEVIGVGRTRANPHGSGAPYKVLDRTGWHDVEDPVRAAILSRRSA
jgi:hypothetical protein